LALILVVVAAALAAPARAADPALQQAVLREINAFRASHGLRPLALDARLSRAATLHSQDMLAAGRMSHTGRDGSDPGARIGRAGYRWRAYRENLGMGYMTVEEAVMGWVRSPAHRANLLAEDVTQAGIGFAGAPGMMWGNVPRLFWTLVLATPR